MPKSPFSVQYCSLLQYTYTTLLQVHSHLTIELKSMMKTSLSRPHPGWFPPKKTACSLLIAVNVKLAHGGGLGPVVGGEDHLPADVEDGSL